MTRIVTGETRVWLTDYADPESLKHDNPEVVLNCITFSRHDMSDSGWTRVGVAKVTIELADEKTVIANKVDSLRSELQRTRADAEVKCNEILSKISQLEALEWNGSTT